MPERSVVIALLSYTGQPHLPVMAFLTDEINAIVVKTGWDVKVVTRSGSGIIPHVRNAIVSDFMTTGATDLIMIDDDNHPDPGGLLRILLPDVDVVGIPCRSRREELIWPVRWLVEEPIARDDKHGLLEVETVGTGIIRITRRAIERMIASDPEAWYVDKSTVSGKSHELFKFGSSDHVYWGEDVHFCRQWRALGGKVWIHSDIVTHHYGHRDHADSVGRWLTQGTPIINYSDAGGYYKEPVPLRNTLSVEELGTKSIALVIASRGNPDKLHDTVCRNLAGTLLNATRIIVALDDDDPALEEARRLLSGFPPEARIELVIAPRPDALGTVYNHCVETTAKADLYINGADDIVLPNGWDARILQETVKFPDNIGAVAIGSIGPGSPLPAVFAVTRELIERMGYFMQPYTPFSWWLDTWLYEIAVMIGRQLPLDLDVELIDVARTRGLRDLTHWARFFDETRPWRRAIAERIVTAPDFGSTPAVKQMLLERMDRLAEKFAASNARLRDEAQAQAITARFAHDAPEDARYQRIKARSLELLDRQDAA